MDGAHSSGNGLVAAANGAQAGTETRHLPLAVKKIENLFDRALLLSDYESSREEFR